MGLYGNSLRGHFYVALKVYFHCFIDIVGYEKQWNPDSNAIKRYDQVC